MKPICGHTAADIIGTELTGSDIIPFMVEIKFPSGKDDRSAFLCIRETLTRIGVASRKEDNTLYQTCHILHKRGKHYICHFKTMFVLDGRENTLTRGDIARQNKIISILQEWGMLTVVNPGMIEDPMATMANIKVVPFSQKSKWNLREKYSIGNRNPSGS